MLYNVLRELRQPLGSVNEFEIAEARLLTEDAELKVIHGTLRLLRTDRGLLATVRASGTIAGECARCLRPVACVAEISLAEEYVPLLDANTGVPVRINEDDTFRINNRWELDLREALRQYILMSEPVKPLCDATCAGLCPQCGADLNAGPHDCGPPVDERWSALAALRAEPDEGS